MSSKYIVWMIALVALVLGVLQHIAVLNALYFTVWWFDIVMHFLGGLWIGLITLWFYKAFAGTRAESGHAYLIALLVLITVGIAWEIFEVLAGMTAASNYIFDTILDLVMDTLGALAATYIVFRKTLSKAVDVNSI